MKIIVAPDKFKGSLTSPQLCYHIKQGILSVSKNADVQVFPMSDGGDGFASVMKYYLHTQTVTVPVTDPLGRSIPASYEYHAQNRTAIIELAAASGIQLLKREEQNPLYTSTFGTGELMKHAIEYGAEQIILGLGGSATTDAGMGILSALGFAFIDMNGDKLEPVGGNLIHINKIVHPQTLLSFQLIIATDVTNVMYGKKGAAFVFAPQKGANEYDVQVLDKGLQHFASVMQAATGKNVALFEGSGAAGGAAAGLAAFFTTQIVGGAGLVINASGVKNAIAGADMLITGEGRLDYQTGSGKIVQHIAALARDNSVKAIALCGNVSIDRAQVKQLGLHAAVSLVNENISEAEAIKKAAGLIEKAAASLFENQF